MARNKRSYDAELNLVPFIDLLSVCISFLLITAVWVQLAKVDMNLPEYSGGGDDAAAAPEKEEVNLTVFLTSSGYKISASAGVADEVPKVDGKYNYEQLKKDLKKLVEKFPQNDKIIIQPDSKIIYEDIIQVMDICLENKLNNMSLSAGVL